MIAEAFELFRECLKKSSRRVTVCHETGYKTQRFDHEEIDVVDLDKLFAEMDKLGEWLRAREVKK